MNIEYYNEFQCHTYGPIGIFLIDMQGNRITGDGVQKSDNPIVSYSQWEAIEAFFQNEDLKVIIVGDDPVSIRDKTANWPYNLEDLTRLLDLSFDWKSQHEDAHEILLLGGDIHCGVSSVVNQSTT